MNGSNTRLFAPFPCCAQPQAYPEPHVNPSRAARSQREMSASPTAGNQDRVPQVGIVNLFGLARLGNHSARGEEGRSVLSGGSGCGGPPGDFVPGTEAVGHLAAVFLGVEQVTTVPEVR